MWFCSVLIGAGNIVWKAVCLVHVTVVLVGAFYLSVMVIQLMLHKMQNPLRYEEGRYALQFI